MCDTLVALGAVTQDGVTLFGKNSDREPNEAHHLQVVPAADHAPGSRVKCTYISIPQAPHTYQVLLAKPFWIWGAEMGANEHQVSIGNEAVFTRVPYDKTPGLTGMDLLRLALERGRTAADALRVITDLIAEHGQGGDCGFSHPFYYHNSFLIADPREAWVLETAGRQWAARKVHTFGTISNALTIHDRWDDASPDLINYAVDRRWCRGQTDFSFAGCYTDRFYTRMASAGERQRATAYFLQERRGSITARDMMLALRQHNGHQRRPYRPDASLSGAGVCMHAGFGPVRINRTTGSMVSQLNDNGAVHWVTATSAPCTSLYKPVWLDAGLPDTGPIPTGIFDPSSLWWRHEKLHRVVMRSYSSRLEAFRSERDRLEGEWLAAVSGMDRASVEQRSAFSDGCFRLGDQALSRWQEVANGTPGSRAWILSRLAWSKFDRDAKVEEG